MPATRPTLGVSFWPDFAYDASGATTLGVDVAEASTMMDGVKSLKRALRWIQMVKTEAIDMAKKLDRFSEQD